MIRAFAVIAVLLSVTAGRAEPAGTPIRFGLTAAVVRENLDLYDRWAEYLGRKVRHPVQFVQRHSYREAMELLENGEHEFSWICSLPYAKYRESKSFGILAVPVFDGEPLYRSYLVVHKDSGYRSIADLKGRVFAYSDPDSNTGYAVPRRMVNELGLNPDSFFRHTFFTYGHTDTIEAVAERVADGAAVDSYVWEYLDRHRSRISAKTKVIDRSEPYGFPPLVYRIGIDPDLRSRMADSLLGMDKDEEGRALLKELMLDRFIQAPSSLYDGVLRNVDRR